MGGVNVTLGEKCNPHPPYGNVTVVVSTTSADSDNRANNSNIRVFVLQCDRSVTNNRTLVHQTTNRRSF